VIFYLYIFTGVSAYFSHFLFYIYHFSCFHFSFFSLLISLSFVSVVFVLYKYPKGSEFRCSMCQYFSKWTLRQHAFQKHDLYIPDGGGSWRPPTDAERKDLEAKLMSGSKRKEGPSATKDKRPRMEAETSDYKDDDASVMLAFDPNSVLHIDLAPGFLLMQGNDRDVEDDPEEMPVAQVRMVATAPPTSNAIAFQSAQLTVAAAVIPAHKSELVTADPDKIMSPEEMVEALAANPELDLRLFVNFVTRECHLDVATSQAFVARLERCRRHLKHYATTLLLDSLEARVNGAAVDDQDKVIVRCLLHPVVRRPPSQFATYCLFASCVVVHTSVLSMNFFCLFV